MKIKGIPRPTGRAPVNPDICYKVKIPLGARGTTATLERMADMMVEASQDPGFVQDARGVVRECRARDVMCEGETIYNYAIDEVLTYRNDPMFMEWLQSPGYTLYVDGSSDCDDASMYVGANDLSIGRGCRLAAYMLDEEKARAGEYSHVLCEMGIRTPRGVEWLGQDTVAKKGFGWRPPQNEWYGEPNFLVIASP